MSWTELVLRFLAGGCMVSLFAAIGEVVQPKSFAGLFGAAPSIAAWTIFAAAAWFSLKLLRRRKARR